MVREMAQVAPWKEAEVRELEKLISEKPVIGLVNVKGIPGPQIQKMRQGLYDKAILRISKIKLLDYCGFKPHLNSCVCCNNKIIFKAKLSLKLGGLLCDRCLNKDIQSRDIFRGTVASILYIEKNDFDNVLRLGMNRAIMKELVYVIDAFLQFHLPG